MLKILLLNANGICKFKTCNNVDVYGRDARVGHFYNYKTDMILNAIPPLFHHETNKRIEYGITKSTLMNRDEYINKLFDAGISAQASLEMANFKISGSAKFNILKGETKHSHRYVQEITKVTHIEELSQTNEGKRKVYLHEILS